MAAVPRPKKYTVLVHGVRVSDFPQEQQTKGIEAILKQNLVLHDQVNILRFGWRKRVLGLKKHHSSMHLDLDSPEGANLLIQEGLVLDHELKGVELYDARCQVTRCFKCRYGHTLRNCKNPERCGICGLGKHASETCPVRNDKTKRRCVTAAGHTWQEARSAYGAHMEELNRARLAMGSKPCESVDLIRRKK